MKAHIDCDGPVADDDVLFEPHHDSLSALGVSLLHKQDDGTLLVPVQNYQGMAVHMEAGASLGEIRSLEPDSRVLTLDEALHSPSVTRDETDSTGSRNATFQAVFNTLEQIDQIVDALSLPVKAF